MTTPLGWSRLVFASAAFALAATYIGWGWSNELTDLGNDSAGYMLAAQYFSPFQAESAVLTSYSETVFYPTLFPLVVGLFGGTLFAGHMVVISCLLGTFACLYVWMRQESATVWTAALTSFVFAAMPGTYSQALLILTENCFLLLSLLAILAVARAERNDERSSRFWALAAAAVAAAPLVRVAGLPLVLAFVSVLTLRRPQRWPWLAVVATSPFPAWMIWSQLTQAGVGTYTAHWAQMYAQDPLGVLIAHLRIETLSLLRAWISAWVGQGYYAPIQLVVVALLMGILCLVGWIARLMRLKFDALYVAIYGVVLLAWPHPEEAQRYAYVIFPVLLAHGALLLTAAGGLPLRAPALLLCVAAISLVPRLSMTVQRFADVLPPDLVAARRMSPWYLDDREQALRTVRIMLAIQRDFARTADYVPPGECVFCIKPAIMTLYSGRTSHTPPPTTTDDDAFERGISRCRFAYLNAGISPSFRQSLYPMDRLGDRARILFVTLPIPGDTETIAGMLVEIAAAPDATR